MVKCTTAEAREKFSAFIKKAAEDKERIVLTRRGKALVALVPIKDVWFWEERN